MVEDSASERHRQLLSACCAHVAEAEALLERTRGALAKALAEFGGEPRVGSCAPQNDGVPPSELPKASGPSAEEEKAEPLWRQQVKDQVFLNVMLSEALEPSDELGQAGKPLSKWDPVQSVGFGQKHLLRKRTSQLPKRHVSEDHWYAVTRRLCGSWKVPIMHPKSRSRLILNTFGICLVIVEMFVIPFNLAFGINRISDHVGLVNVVDVYFIADIGMTFLTAYKNEDGVLVVNPRRIARRYLGRWFLPELISSIPWNWLDYLFRVPLRIRLLRIVRFVRILRFFRQSVVTKRGRMIIEESPLLVFWIGVGRVICGLCLVTHWAACAWFIVGTHYMSKSSKTWVTQFMSEDEGLAGQYAHSLYFALTTFTTVGYGDISPQNGTERIFGIGLLLLASIVFASLMGSLTELIGTLNTEKHRIAAQVQKLGQYMHWRHVPPSLYDAVRSHLHHTWMINKGFDEYEVNLKSQLTPVLQKELSYHIYGRVLRSVPFFAWMREHEAVLKEMSILLQSMVLSQGDVLFRIGMRNEQVYVMLTGKVRVTLNEDLSQLAGKKRTEDDVGWEDKEDHQTMGAQCHVPRDTDHVVYQLAEKKHEKQVVTAINRMQKLAHQTSEQPTVVHDDVSGHQSQAYAADIFCSDMLHDAEVALQTDINRQRWAARFVQKRWRRRHHRPDSGADHRVVVPHSVTVNAPSYFGESCLWVPYEEWDDHEPPTYKYNTRCDSLVELVYIHRNRVKEIIDRFSPWLAERFEIFRNVVFEEMNLVHTGENRVCILCGNIMMLDTEVCRRCGASASNLRRASGSMPAAAPEPAEPKAAKRRVAFEEPSARAEADDASPRKAKCLASLRAFADKSKAEASRLAGPSGVAHRAQTGHVFGGGRPASPSRPSPFAPSGFPNYGLRSELAATAAPCFSPRDLRHLAVAERLREPLL